ncbi:MAG: hypothetical protein KC535_00165 [Nanoarchaeota archaeon]|nr:hypothetical protein [Nanoarchaeota archaeon]
MEQINLERNAPEKKFRASPVTATIWANEAKNKDGETGMFRTISLERSYRDKDGIWKSTSSLRVNDLPKAMLVLQKAYEYITFKEESDQIEEI